MVLIDEGDLFSEVLGGGVLTRVRGRWGLTLNWHYRIAPSTFVCHIKHGLCMYLVVTCACLPA